MTVARRQQISVFELSSVVNNLQSQLAATSQAAALQLATTSQAAALQLAANSQAAALQLGAANTEISGLRAQQVSENSLIREQ